MSPTPQSQNGQSRNRPEVRAFWTGPALSFYERLSLTSFVQAGAKVQLFTYDRDLVVPDGVERIDANEILPGAVHGFRGPSGDTSYALHSDLFRYAALDAFGGWYADLDIIFIGKSIPDDPIYVARQTAKVLNGAVMKLPAKHPLLAAAIREAQRLLPDTSASTGHEARCLIGPPLVTKLFDDFSLDSVVRPRSSAYEIGYDEVRAFFDPASCDRLQDRLADSDFTHLWNEVWRWLRIPKDLGPPKGSYLDKLFDRAGLRVPDRARLAYEAITDWFNQHDLIESCKYWLKEDRLPADALDRIVARVHKYYQDQTIPEVEAPDLTAPKVAATSPCVLQTFWHGDAVDPYQLLCLRSFVDRGHRVELFTYNPQLRVPGWIDRRNAAEILPRDQILKPHGNGLAINGNLFRYAVLHKRGGWWIDPDIVLLAADLPGSGPVFAGLDEFGLVSTSLLRFPKGHDVLEAALSRSRAFDSAVADWDRTGAPLLTELLTDAGVKAPSAPSSACGPVSWFEVPALFDPARCEDLEARCRTAPILRLHIDVWRRSGIPSRLAPPEGSFLDRLFQRHDVSALFSDRMTFDEVNRWIGHMYECVRTRQNREP